jgi:hypothetical protein
MVSGSKDVENFYNGFGWRVQSGQTGDAELFWPADAGPLRAVMERQRLAPATPAWTSRKRVSSWRVGSWAPMKCLSTS